MWGTYRLPGQRTRAKLLSATWPPAIAWMRSGMRLSIAGAIYLAGFHNVAKIVAVLAIINLLGAIEGQVSRVLLDVWRAAVDLVRRKDRP